MPAFVSQPLKIGSTAVLLAWSISRTFSSVLAVSVLAGLAVLLGPATNVQGQSAVPQSQPNWDYGFELFQMLIEERGLKTVERLDQVLRAPRDSALVIIGAPPRNFMAADWSNLVRFVDQGGALLIASESTFTIPGVGDFNQGPVTSRNPLYQYREFDDCLVLAANANAPAPFSDMRQFVTNRSGWFEPNPIGWLTWQPMVTFPNDSDPPEARQQALLTQGTAAGSDNGGLALVLADSSLLSNSMLWHGENAVLAIRTSELLSKTNKRQLLFIAERQVQSSYRTRIQVAEPDPSELPQRELAEPELQKALRLANAVAKEVANSNVLNEALQQRPRNIPPGRYLRAILYTVALSLLVGIAWILISNRPLQAIFLGPRRMRAAFEMRDLSSNTSSDYRNAASYLAREFCFELTDSRNTADWQKYLAAQMSQPPSLQTPKSQPRNLQELTKVIDIACRGCHSKMLSLEFQQFGTLIDQLRTKQIAGPIAP